MLGKHALKPQEETVLRIIYKTTNRPGLFRKRVLVTTNVPEQKYIMITIKGIVDEAPAAKIKVEPRKLQLGTLKTISVLNLIYRITNEGREPLVITKIHKTENTTIYFDGDKEGNLIVGAGESRVFELEFKPLQQGPFVQVIFVDSNARNARHGRYAIMLIGRVEEK